MANQKAKNKELAKAGKYSFTEHAWNDYLSWQETDPKKVEEINSLLEECSRNPFTGTGKPKPLKGDLTGYWSRRIDKEHRLVYLPEDGRIYIMQCRLHYKK